MKSMMMNIVAAFIGLISGVLVYGMFIILVGSFNSGSTETDSTFSFIAVLLLILGGVWALSTFLLVNRAISVGKVFARGFLLLAAEWLFMIVVTIANAMKIAVAANLGTKSNLGSALGATFGAVAIMTTVGFCFIMSASCMVGYAVSRFMPIEMEPERLTKECQFCGALVNRDTIACRFCSRSFTR